MEMAKQIQAHAAGHRSCEPLVAAVRRTAARHGWLPPGTRLLVAVSGGADSVALLHALLAMAPDIPLHLSIAHLDHGLRGAAARRDAAFVADLARRLGLACHLGQASVPAFRARHRLSIEAAARSVRYDFLERSARQCGAERVALGHTADDSAELVLMHLLRGSGPLGLSGIAPQRDALFIRPLIDVTRRQVLAFLQAQHLAWVEDESNRDTRFLRNRVRHQLLPELERSYNPRLRKALLRLATICRADEECLEQAVEPLFRDARMVIDGGIGLRRSVLAQLPPALLWRLIRRAIAAVKGDLRGIGHQHVLAATGLLESGAEPRELHLPGPLRVACHGALIGFILPARAPGGRPAAPIPLPHTEFSIELPGPGRFAVTPLGAHISLTLLPEGERPDTFNTGHMEVFFDMAEISFPLVMRSFRSGDRFTPLGQQGTQKVKKFFIDHKIPRRQRANSAVLTCADRIIWLVGYRLDASVRVRSCTTRVLRLRLEKLA